MNKFMGIDWNGRKQGVVITLLIKKAKSVEVKKFKLKGYDQKQVEKIAELIRKHKPKSVVADHGFGQMQIQTLQKEFGELIKSCYYGSHEKMNYNTDTCLLTVGRGHTLDSLLQFIWKETGSLAGLKSESELHSFNYAYIASNVYAGEEAFA